jgi:hypothetical protein
MLVEFTRTRHYVSVGFYHTGDRTNIGHKLAEQLIEQGFARRVSAASKPQKKDEERK